MNQNTTSGLVWNKYLPASNRWLLWFALALLIKSAIFLFKVNELSSIENRHFPALIAREAGDTYTYLQPVENLIFNGNYDDDFRMPGYGWIYYLLRAIFQTATALDFLVIFQLLLASFSVYILAKIAELLFKKQIYFYLTFTLYALSSFVSLYDPILLTESFATSSLIISFYFFFLPDMSKKQFVASGLFLTWCIFLKPVFAPLLIVFSFFLILKIRLKKQETRLQISKMLAAFLIPFLLVDGIWTVRNYKVHQGFYPLTTSLYFASTNESYLGALFQFLHAYGGSIVWWEPGADITYFKPLTQANQKKLKVQPPAYIYTTEFTPDSLLSVKNKIALIDNPETDSVQRMELTVQVKEQLNRYTQSIKKEKPILYYFASRIKVCKTFFLHSGTYNLFNQASSELNVVKFFFKVIYSLLYLAVAGLGVLGLVIILFRTRQDLNLLFFALCSIYAGFSFPLLLKLDEYRYFVTAYPLFLIAGIFASMSIFGFLKNKLSPNA